ncbi:MAG: TonB-dependent receptor [Gemmatimonadota bacterium]
MRSTLKMCFLAAVMIVVVPADGWAQNGTITGLVTDAESLRPVVNARVEAFEPDGRPAGSTMTNNDGRFRLAVDAGTYNLSVQSVGYAATEQRSVVVPAGGSVTANVALTISAFQLNPVVVSASKREEKATDAPAHVEVVTEQEIALRPALSPTDHLRSVPGIDVITQGVQSSNVVARGFNNVFSGSLHMITDNRLAGVPSLRVNVPYFVPTTNEDLQRIEVVLGPGAALYGPNTASGVLHMITKSPLIDPGTTVSLTGGEQDIFQGSVRTAHRLTDRLGVKLSAQYLTGTEWDYVDPDEAAERAKFAADPFFRQDLIRSTGISEAEADRRIAAIGNRDMDISRWTGEGRVDWLITPDLSTVVQAGVSNVGTGVELTGLGAGQIDDWRSSYVQTRANWKRLFAQVYMNMSDAGETYLLRTGQPIIDESTLLVGQVQHGFDLGGRQSFTYGLDYFHTNPQTEGTINGIYEDEDETTEVGGYVQSETALTPKFDLVLAGRLDDHSALPDVIFSPRAALVFKPVENQAIRATYNQAFSTPTSLNQFLDLATSVPDQATKELNAIAARLGYSVRVQGTGTSGFTFREGGAYQMRSPFSPALGIGPSETLLPANAALFYPAALGAALQGGAGAHPLMTPARIQFLAGLRPTAADVGTNFIEGTSSFPIADLNLADIQPIRETTTTTYELGYQGVVRERFSIAADVWSSQIEDFVTPLTVTTPFLSLNGPELGTYIATQLATSGQASPADAQALAAFLTPLLARVPVGVISSTDVNATGAQMLATYTNVDETLDVWGADIGVQALLTPVISLSLNGSIVSDDHFETSVGVVTLNAPKRKGAIALAYRPEEGGLNGEIRARYNTEFPVKSGVYEGTACLGDNLSQPCVESFTLLDLSVGYELPQLRGASVQFSVQNVLDEDYRSFPGVPNIGRLALLRLKYDF